MNSCIRTFAWSLDNRWKRGLFLAAALASLCAIGLVVYSLVWWGSKGFPIYGVLVEYRHDYPFYGKSVDQWGSDLADPDVLVRCRAATSLAKILHEKRGRMSQEAGFRLLFGAEELGSSEADAATPELVRALHHEDQGTIVVDTGSIDGTRELAARLGAKVFEFPWCDDFAAGRNECIRHATGDYIFWMDADEQIDSSNREKLQKHFQSLSSVRSQESAGRNQKTEVSNQATTELRATDYGRLTNVAFVMKCLSVQPGETRHGTVVDHVRLFRNRPDVRWKYRVHEQILPALRATAAEVIFTDIVIQHTGYVDTAFTRQKLERNLLHRSPSGRAASTEPPVET